MKRFLNSFKKLNLIVFPALLLFNIQCMLSSNIDSTIISNVTCIELTQAAVTIPNAGGTYQFTDVLMGDTLSSNFSLSNTSSSSVELTGTPLVKITGTNAADFSVISLPGSPISTGSSTTFTIQFAPSATGTRSALAGIDTSCGEIIFEIRGNGTSLVQPEINVKVNTSNVPSGTVNYDIGSTAISSNLDVTFTIENTGGIDLNLTGSPRVNVSGTYFSLQTDAATPVTTSGSTTFVIRYAPSASGPHTATISIANDDSDESAYSFTIKASTTDQPEINVKQNLTNVPSGTVNYSIGTTAVSSNVDVTFTIENTGGAALNLTGSPRVNVSGTYFSLQTDAATPVTTSGSTTFVIRYAPSVSGSHTATISIANDDSDESAYSFSIQASTEPNVEAAWENSGTVFDGVNYVDLGASPSYDVQAPFSISLYFKTAMFDSSNNRYLVGKGDPASSGFALYLKKSKNTLEFKAKDLSKQDVACTTTINDDVWHHVAIVFNDVSLIIYIDGTVEKDSASHGTVTYDPDTPIWIGSNPLFPGDDLKWIGDITGFKLYSRELSAAEVSALAALTP